MYKLYRKIYNNLDIEDKKELLYKIEKENCGFKVIDFEEFSLIGQRTYTAIYDYKWNFRYTWRRNWLGCRTLFPYGNSFDFDMAYGYGLSKNRAMI